MGQFLQEVGNGHLKRYVSTGKYFTTQIMSSLIKKERKIISQNFVY